MEDGQQGYAVHPGRTLDLGERRSLRSSFAGMVGDALIMLGNLKVGGALKVIQGIGEIVIGISDIAANGLNVDNALTVVRGLTNVAIGIGVFTGNIKLAAWSVAIQGFTPSPTVTSTSTVGFPLESSTCLA